MDTNIAPHGLGRGGGGVTVVVWILETSLRQRYYMCGKLEVLLRRRYYKTCVSQRWCGYVAKADEYVTTRRMEINVTEANSRFGHPDLLFDAS